MYLVIIGTSSAGMAYAMAIAEHTSPTMVVQSHQEEKEEAPRCDEKILAIREHDIMEEFFPHNAIIGLDDYRLKEKYLHSLAHTALKNQRICYKNKKQCVPRVPY